MTRRAAFLGTACIGLVFAACSSSTEATPAPAGPVALRPAALFTGYDDGSATYKVPATLANGSKNVKWVVADATLASVETEPGNPIHAIVITKKAGKTTLRATDNGKTYEVPLTITQYTPGARELGNDLYQEDRSSGPGADAGDEPTKALGCIACHGARGSARHSPSEIGGFDDATILKTIATAERPGGKGLANNGNHKYTLNDKEKEGILARLRSLEPVEFPE
jgi:hypothetical protein